MLGVAYRFTVEMLAGIGVGGFIGWWMDKWFGTAPAFLLILLFLGMFAGVVNSVRTVNEMRRSLDQNAAGTARVPLPIPGTASPLGPFNIWWGVLDPSAPSTLGIPLAQTPQRNLRIF